jgi:hypothetical protein
MSGPKVYAPFKVDDETAERANLDPGDVGKWALIVAGCYHLFKTKADADQCRRRLQA